jgi:hypothetical protein
MKVKQRLLGLLIAGFIILPAISIFADDEKLYPGSMGIRWNNSLPDPVLSWGRIGNPSSTRDLYLDLPIIHDIIDRSIKSGYVSVVDSSSNRSIRCTLNSVFFFGSSTFRYRQTPPRESKSVTSNGVEEKLWFPGVSNNRSGNSSLNNSSHYFYSCRIPQTSNGRRSYILSYAVKED